MCDNMGQDSMDAVDMHLAGLAPMKAPGFVVVASLAAMVICGPCSCKHESPGACDYRQCGTWEGQGCGTCADFEFCDDHGQCRQACLGRQCGLWHGVSCGDCAGVENCVLGQCYNVCDNRCGLLQGMDCGECSSFDEICSADGYCTSCEPPPCPEEFGPAGEVCINGCAYWLMDEDRGVFMTSRMWDTSAPEDATSIVVKAYDALLYAQDPQSTPPLGIGEVDPVFGTFRILDVAIPGTGFIALVLDDLDDDMEDRFATTGVSNIGSPNQHLEGVAAFGVTRDQEAEWTAAIGGDAALELIGCPEPPGGGPRTLLTCGTWVALFVSFALNGPVEGVRLYEPSEPISAEKTFYPGINADGELVFDDPTEGVVWSDDQGPHEWTGILGAVFYTTASLGNMTGECVQGTPCSDVGCIFMEHIGGTIPGIFSVQYMLLVACSE